MMKLRSLTLILVVSLVLVGRVHGEQNAVASSSSSSSIIDEFADTNEAGAGVEYNYFERHLQTSETTTCNFWCQLKNSLGLTIVGLLLICISPCLMWKNEGRHVRELRRIDFCKNKAVVVENSDNPSADTVGQLVYFVGNVTVDESELELADDSLNLSQPVPKALIIKRTAYIYQKFEDASSQTKQAAVGGKETTTTTYTCREDWTPMGPQPAQLPHLPNETNTSGIWDSLVTAAGGDPSAESNPAVSPGMPPPQIPPGMSPSNMPAQMQALLQIVDNSKAPNGIAVSPAAHAGGFGLSEEIITETPQVFSPEWSPVPAEYIPNTVNGCEGLTKHSDGVLCTQAEGEKPTNGDVMVKYEYCGDGFECSFIVQQVAPTDADPEAAAQYGVEKAKVIDDKCFGKIHDDLGVIWMVRRGHHDLASMIKMAKEDESKLTKILRILCYLLLIAGWIMLFSIFQTFFNTLPILKQLGAFAIFLIAFIVGTACCCGITALAYFRYRPMLSFIIIALVLGIWGITAGVMGSNYTPTSAPTAAPTSPAP